MIDRPQGERALGRGAGHLSAAPLLLQPKAGLSLSWAVASKTRKHHRARVTQPPSQRASREFSVRKGTAVPILVGGPGSKFLACLQALKFTHGIGALILFSMKATSQTHTHTHTQVGLGGAAPSPRESFSETAFLPSRPQQNRLKGGGGRLEWTRDPQGCPGLEGLESTGASGVFPLGLGDASSFLSELGVGTPWCTRRGSGHLVAGRVTLGPPERGEAGEGRGNVSGRRGTPASAGGGGGALLHQAPRPQAAPPCPVTQELEAFQAQGLVGRPQGRGWWSQSWGCWWGRQQ